MEWKSIPGEELPRPAPHLPEVPYTHDYSQTMTMKMYLADPLPDGGSRVYISVDEALEKIRAVDRITLGTKKIVYLVGWQYDGHDSKYPAWGECNPALRRPCDASARDSLRWLFEEAKKYNTTVSVHINMMDAYENSPLWNEYREKNLLCRNADGGILAGGFWGGRQAYLVCYKREWDSGMAVRRINGLCELLPIREAGTVHIDAFMNPCLRGGCCDDNPGDRMGEASIETRRKIYRYFRSLGIDVTSEYMCVEPECESGRDYMIGLQPMAWHLCQLPEDYLRRPAQLICGGNTKNRQRGEVGVTMGRLFGENVQGEGIFPHKNYKELFLSEFCCRYLPFTFLNGLDRLRIERYGNGAFRAYFSEGISSDTDQFTIRRGDSVLKQGNTLMLPARWLPEDNRILYSDEAGEHVWQIGAELGDRIRIRRLTADGPEDESFVADTVNGSLSLVHDATFAYLCTRA